MIDLKIGDDGIAVLAINQPTRSMNVIDWELNTHLSVTVDKLAADPNIKGVIVTSGKTSFVAGADLAIMKAFVKPSLTPRGAADLIATIGNALRRLETLGKPVVGASTGTALGGGLEILLACHYRIAADNPAAQYGLPEVKLGLLPGAGGTQRLPRAIGIAKALPLLTEGKALHTAEALSLGIFDEIVPADQLISAARSAILEGRVRAIQPWDQKGFRIPGGDASLSSIMDVFIFANGQVASKPGANFPAPRAILSCVYEGSRLPIDKALAVEQMYFAQLVQGTVSQGLIRTQFFARQAADKLTRRPKGVPPAKISRLGVLGTGFMGQGIARVAAQCGISVVLVDRDKATAEAALAEIRSGLEAEVGKGRMSADTAAACAARLSAGQDVTALKDCELVIEAAPEVLDLKRKLIAQCEAVVSPHTIFASNTSTLPIGSLAGASVRPQQVVGLHFFSPVPKMPLVEVIKGPDTSDAVLAHALDFVRQIRKTPIIVNDAYGFYTTRCVVAFIREGLRLLAEGASVARIENGAIGLGMPVGPLTLADEVGIDVLHHIQQEARHASGDAYIEDNSDRLIERLYQAGRFGRKTKAGLFDYGQDGKKPGDGFDGAEAATAPTQAEIAERLLVIQLLAASVAWGEGIITDAGEADLGAVLGWAFPAHLGGPLSAIDDCGVANFVRQAESLSTRWGPRFASPKVLHEMAANGARFHRTA